MEKINLNARPDPFLGKLYQSEDQLMRLAHIALPFLFLCKPTRVVVNALLNAAVLTTVIRKGEIAASNNESPLRNNLLITSFLTLRVYLSIFRPLVGLSITNLLMVMMDISKKRVFEATSKMLYLLSIASRTPRIMLRRPEITPLSSIMQIINEAKEGYSEYKKERYLEVSGLILLLALRTFQTTNEVSNVFNHYCGRRSFG
ncbi:MAG: hypothetical protein KFB93_05505 [Simkaniaceae bacterium]|nr:MAG: hypothetical protein KFB93_05505 [Simkaniaceae bacterium]